MSNSVTKHLSRSEAGISEELYFFLWQLMAKSYIGRCNGRNHAFQYRPIPIHIGNIVSDFEVPDTILTLQYWPRPDIGAILQLQPKLPILILKMIDRYRYWYWDVEPFSEYWKLGAAVSPPAHVHKITPIEKGQKTRRKTNKQTRTKVWLAYCFCYPEPYRVCIDDENTNRSFLRLFFLLYML